MAIDAEQEVGPAGRASGKKRSLPGVGLIKGLGVTLKHLLQPPITQQYPDEKPNLPPRTRGVIARKEENCTVCYLADRECPDWCIYIDAHKETHPPASGAGRGRSVKVLDRFAIDYALCMYCGICVEVCPFDALFWAPDFEYAEYDIVEMTHEKERLEEWTYKVLPPPPLEDGATLPETPEETPVATAEGEPVAARPPSAEEAAPGAQPPPQAGPPRGAPVPPAPAAAAAPAAPADAATPATPAPAPAGPSRPAPDHVEPDQEAFERVLAEELAKGTDRRVAEGRARAAGVRAARKKAEG